MSPRDFALLGRWIAAALVASAVLLVLLGAGSDAIGLILGVAVALLLLAFFAWMTGEVTADVRRIARRDGRQERGEDAP